MTDTQPTKSVQGPYTVTLEDLGCVLVAISGPIVLPFGMPLGFFVSILNSRGATIALQTPGASLITPNSGTSLTLRGELVTVGRLLPNSSDWSCGQL